MSDIIDAANDQVEKTLALLLKHRKQEGPHPTGKCLWCGEDVKEKLRWCDKACLDDYEHYNRK